jgi:putative glutathione S-transferase
MLDDRLSRRRYLFGAAPLEMDWRLFVTLVRFDPVYVGHFKCKLRRIAETVNFDHIKRHYYMTHAEINPTAIVPIGPAQDLWAPHGRESL